MKLFTQAQLEQLLDNGRRQAKVKGTANELDFFPVVKLFNAYGAGTWLLTEIHPDNHDWAFGLCDLGCDCAELGDISLSELSALRHPFGFPLIERDRHWEATAPLSAYVKASVAARRIIDRLPVPA
ncbi:MAG: DUF2958 domain-containing protein [Hyphomicrobium sp.]